MPTYSPSRIYSSSCSPLHKCMVVSYHAMYACYCMCVLAFPPYALTLSSKKTATASRSHTAFVVAVSHRNPCSRRARIIWKAGKQTTNYFARTHKCFRETSPTMSSHGRVLLEPLQRSTYYMEGGNTEVQHTQDAISCDMATTLQNHNRAPSKPLQRSTYYM